MILFLRLTNPLLIIKEHERTRLQKSETKLRRQMLVRQQQLAGSPDQLFLLTVS